MQNIRSPAWRAGGTVRTYAALIILVMMFGMGIEEAPRKFPSFDELWVPKDTLESLARRHGVLSLKITETHAYIKRNAKWIPVLARNKS
jgi:hypothetical protein